MQDALTGSPNRRRFDQELKGALSAPPHSHGAHAVFLLDLNAFKRINDLYGHGIGDEVLINIAMRLRRAARQEDLVTRFGGDEFAILARELAGSEDATNIALRVIKELDQPIATGPLKHHVGVAIGIALLPQDGRSEIEILRRADIALYRAKDEKSKSASRFFDADMDARTQERDLIERDLPGAINKGDVRPYYQPLIDLQTKHIVGFEALARWRHPTLGEVSPERFIPVAESCDLIAELTDHLLRQAARDATRWLDSLTLSFNISPSQLKERTLGLRILTILAEAGLSPRRLEIELTESALMRDLAGAQAGCRRAHRAGRFRHRIFQPLSSAQLQDRQDQDRPQFRRQHGARAGGLCIGACTAWIRSRSGIDGDRRRRGKAGAGGRFAAGRVPAGAGLSL